MQVIKIILDIVLYYNPHYYSTMNNLLYCRGIATTNPESQDKANDNNNAQK